MKYLKQFAIIITITFIAEVLSFFVPLPVPSGIYGMVILFALLCLKIIKPEQIEGVADFLITIMGVMFVPAGVGILENVDPLLSMLTAAVLSITAVTLIVMFVSGRVTEFFVKKDGD